ncbi:MAG: type I restriction enzyme HsdR N-terminal domain-containing protein [Saprospiraceae bacterium]|nr:type I restriction enzyme HsdR N-terminal domain-containing protein [Saprospiraceae bacterium]
MKVIDLNLQSLESLVQRSPDQLLFDPVRKKWVKNQPEEFVRQLMIIHLHKILGYSYSNMAVERLIKLHGLSRRFDILVYDKNARPLILVECKSFESNLSQEVWNQVARYNFEVRARYLCITSGLQSLIARIDHEKGVIEELEVLPHSSLLLD